MINTKKEIEEFNLELRRNENKNDGWHYKYEDLKNLKNILENTTYCKYSMSELDDLLNILFEKGIIK